MKHKLFGVLVMVVLALVVNVNAQNKARVNVSFAFVVADKELPAGTYDISEVAAHAILIRDFRNGTGMVVQSQPARGKALHSQLVFHKYRERYFLYQAWSIDGQGIQIRESALEQEERALASNVTSAPQEVIVALR